MDEIQETLRWNEDVARKLAEIEREIADSPDPTDLFEHLMLRMETAFGIPFVWLSLVRTPQADALRSTLAVSALLGDRLNLIDGDAFAALLDGRTEPLLVNGDLRSFYRLLPPAKKFLFRSLALVPFTLDGTVVGSLNHGDPSPQRYHPDLATDLLAQLGARVSARLGALSSKAVPLPASP
jgi:uncharacterized protein YigA (DUF484 family)